MLDKVYEEQDYIPSLGLVLTKKKRGQRLQERERGMGERGLRWDEVWGRLKNGYMCTCINNTIHDINLSTNEIKIILIRSPFNHFSGQYRWYGSVKDVPQVPVIFQWHDGKRGNGSWFAGAAVLCQCCMKTVPRFHSPQ